MFLMDLDYSDTELTVRGNEVTVSYSFYDCSFSLQDIQSVELLDKLPNDDFSRENGGDVNSSKRGHMLRTNGALSPF